MDLSRSDLFDLARARLAWLGQRQSALAENIANIDTPGYRARDVRSFSDELSGATGLVRTVPSHLSGTAAGSVAARSIAGERAPDGNAVSLTAELLKVADTDQQQALALNITRKYAGMVRMALGK